MSGSVWILIVLFVFFVALMASRMWGKSLDRLFAERNAEHHRVMEVLAQHPEGGTWREFRRWMAGEGR